MHYVSSFSHNYMCVTVIRGIGLDEKVYKDPRSFNPDRYLPKPYGDGEPYVPSSFGFGRRFGTSLALYHFGPLNAFLRICPGRYVADANLWIAIASILATFSISKVIGVNGEEMSPSLEFSVGLVK